MQPSIDQFLRDTSADALGTVVTELSDIAVLVGRDGVVLDVPHVKAPAEKLEPARWRGQAFATLASARSRTAVDELLETLRIGTPASGRDIVHVAQDEREIVMRYGGAPLVGKSDIMLFGRALPSPASNTDIDFGSLFAAGAGEGPAGPEIALGDMLRHSSDMVAMIDASGRLLWANDSFHSVAETSLVAGIEGMFLEDMVEWSGQRDLDDLIAEAARTGACPPIAATLRGNAGARLAVTLGLTALPGTSPVLFGAVMRSATPAAAAAAAIGTTPALAALLGQAGQVPLKGLVRETADMVERHCVQAALKLSGNNRSAAARALGISRQALYLKLERYGMLEG